jgi:hypothetical protein
MWITLWEHVHKYLLVVGLRSRPLGLGVLRILWAEVILRTRGKFPALLRIAFLFSLVAHGAAVEKKKFPFKEGQKGTSADSVNDA